MWYVVALMCYTHSVILGPPRCTVYKEKQPTLYMSEETCLASEPDHRTVLVDGAVAKGFVVHSFKIECVSDGKDV